MNLMNSKAIFIILSGIFLKPCLSSAQVSLRIQVSVPKNTPPKDSLLVIGNQEIWGNWIYPKARTMQKLNDSTWIQQCQFPAGTQLNFKITRGSYYKEAVYNHTGAAQEISLKLQKDTTILLKPSNWNDIFQRSITGTVRYHHNFSSPLLKNTRNVVVWLPPSYFTSAHKRYPVLYAHDGQNIFDHSGGSGGEWRMDEVADSLMRKNKIEEFIIVGIANTRDRWVEYNGTPEGYNYVRFIATELKPFIDKHYRTKTDKANTAAIGSSMGGLISFYMAWLYPDIFSKVACLSSGFYFDEGNILAKCRQSSSRLNGSRIYLDCGGQDLDKDFLPANEDMNKVLSGNKSIKLSYQYFQKDKHNEYAWAKRLYVPFLFLFGKQ